MGLREIEAAKSLYGGRPENQAQQERFLENFTNHKLPKCPAGGNYLINREDDNPTCTAHGDLLSDCDDRGRLSELKVRTRDLLRRAQISYQKLRVNEEGRLVLGLESSLITNLDILKGLPIAFLDLKNCSNVTDLGPLEGMPLSELTIAGTKVQHLSPLHGAPLRYLDGADGITDLTPLKGMPLDILYLDNAKVHDLSALRGAPLTHLLLGNSVVSDLTPLIGMPLKHLHLPLESIMNDIALIRSIKTLEQFRARHQDICDSPDKFWAMYDTGQISINVPAVPIIPKRE